MEPLNGPHETRLRQTLAPTPDAVERVVRRALSAPRRETVRLSPAAALIAMLLVAAALLVWPLARRPAGGSVASIETVGEVLLVRPKHGPVSLITSYPEPSSPTGILIVIHGGGQ
jgi:hypothetical protein